METELDRGSDPESLQWTGYRFGEQGIPLARTLTRIIGDRVLREEQISAILDGWLNGFGDREKYEEDMKSGVDRGGNEVPF